MQSARVKWQVLEFSKLTPLLLYSVLQLRSEVFVVEQNCVFQDMDGLDQAALHLLAIDNTGLIAYARILAPGTRYPEASIGRLINRSSVRRSGLGKALLGRAIEECVQMFPDVGIRISAQQYLEKFYRQFGFEVDSAPYLEDGIPHLEMLKKAAVRPAQSK